MTVVYVDSVFFLNALVDYLLLLSAAQLAGAPLKRLRFFLAAVLGGGYAVAVFLPGCGFLSSLPGKLASGIAMAAVAYGGERRFIRLTLLLFAVSCGFAGCVLALGLLAGGGSPVVNGVFYTDVNSRVLLISAVAAYLVLTVVFRASARRSGANGVMVPVTVAFSGRTVSLTALCDTGNALRDPLTGRSVLVVSAERLAPLWPQALRPLLTPGALRSPPEVLGSLGTLGAASGFRLLPYSAVGLESGLLLAVKSDWTEIGTKRHEKLLLALSPTQVGDGCDALWGELEKGGCPHAAMVK